MPKLLIAYEMNSFNGNCEELCRQICALGPARQILKNVWVVKTMKTAHGVQLQLGRLMKANDKLFVTSFVLWSGTHLPLQDSQWLRLP